jgi:hypothetical protein
MSQRVQCANGGWVFGTYKPFPTDPAVYMASREAGVPCNQLLCERCQTPVKHMEGVKIDATQPRNLRELYDSLDPDAWIDLVRLDDEYRLYFCRCKWYSTSGANPVGHLDTHNIDDWVCAGHPLPG